MIASIAALGLLLAGVVGITAPVAPAAADPTERTITGTVSLPSGAPQDWMRGVTVIAIPESGGLSTATAFPLVSTGVYSLTGLTPGSYRLQFGISQYYDADTSTYVTPNLTSSYYPGVPEAVDSTPVSVTDADATGINIALTEGRSISGTVSIPAGADPAWLGAISVDAVGGSAGYRSATTDATGAYTITGLGAGSYTVSFRPTTVYDSELGQIVPNLLGEYYDDATLWEEATPVVVGSADVSGIDAELELGTTITGIVTYPEGTTDPWSDSVSWAPADGTASVGPVSPIGVLGTFDPTTLTRTYSIVGLRPELPGNVRYQSFGSGLLSQWWTGSDGGSWSQSEAATITAPATGVNFVLSTGATVTGTVQFPEGFAPGDSDWSVGSVRVLLPSAPLMSQYVTSVSLAVDDYDAATRTIDYEVAGLPGSALVFAYDAPYQSTTVSSQYWDRKSVQAQADQVTPALSGGTTVDFDLTEPASVSGTLALPAGSVTQADVTGETPLSLSVALLVADSYVAGTSVRVTEVEPDGSVAPIPFTITASVPVATDFTVQATSYLAQERRAGVMKGGDAYRGVWRTEFVEPSISAGGERDLGAIVLEKSTLITGEVTLANPPANLEKYSATATLYEFVGGAWVERPQAYPVTASVSPTVQSPYSFTFLPAGTYTVGFTGASTGLSQDVSMSYCPEFFDGSATLEDATPVTLTSSTWRTDVGATLERCTPIVAGTPTITGSSAFGGTLTAAPGAGWIPTTGVDFGYQWLLDGEPISGANTATYTPAIAQIGADLSVRVTGTAPNRAPASATSSVVQVLPGTVTTATPTISGTAQAGEELTVAPGTWSPSGVSFQYDWFASGVVDAIGTGASLVLTADEVGRTITVAVTGSLAGYSAASATSAPTTEVVAAPLPPFDTAPTPTISGTPALGVELAADTSAWVPTPDTLTLQWLSNGAVIDGATQTTFTPDVAQVGTAISVRTTAMKDGVQTTSRTSLPTSLVAPGELSSGTPAITGVPTVGTSVTVDPGWWGPSPVALSYQWFLDDVAVAGGTTESLALTAASVGQEIRVEVTGTKAGYAAATVSTVDGVAVQPGTITPVTPVVDGMAQVGTTLTATLGAWDPAVAISTQWFAEGEAIDGATGTSLVLDPSLLGAESITIRATGTRLGYTPAVAESTPIAGPVAPGQIVGSAPVITGSGQVGSPFSVTLPGWGPAPIEVAYAWTATLPGEPSVHGTGATFATHLVGASVSVVVTATKPGYAERIATADFDRVVTPSLVPSGLDPVAGSTIRIEGEGYIPGETVRIELHSTPVLLATVTADGAGRISATVTIPSGTTPGAHHIVAIGSESAVEVRVAITVARAPLAGTGAELDTAPIIAGGLALLLGIALVAGTARRRSQH